MLDIGTQAATLYALGSILSTKTRTARRGFAGITVHVGVAASGLRYGPRHHDQGHKRQKHGGARRWPWHRHSFLKGAFAI